MRGVSLRSSGVIFFKKSLRQVLLEIERHGGVVQVAHFRIISIDQIWLDRVTRQLAGPDVQSPPGPRYQDDGAASYFSPAGRPRRQPAAAYPAFR
jgi:hypothetical protein